jgi:hypothetical protein
LPEEHDGMHFPLLQTGVEPEQQVKALETLGLVGQTVFPAL